MVNIEKIVKKYGKYRKNMVNIEKIVKKYGKYRKNS